MEWNQPSVVLSLIALIVSIASLGWNIYNKISGDLKKLKISAYFYKSQVEGKFYECCIAVTNIGVKPITIENIEVVQKQPRRNLHGFYRDYKTDIKNRPIQPGEERVIVKYDSKENPYYDKEKKSFRNIRIVINDTQGQAYRSKWFVQNTHSPNNVALKLESGKWIIVKQ